MHSKSGTVTLTLMKQLLKVSGLLVAAALAAAAFRLLRADTITQIDAEGRQRIIQRQAILVHQDANVILYKHFDLKSRRVIKTSLDQGSLPYEITTSSAAERQQIVKLWKEFGYTATLTDRSGKTTRIFDLYLDFYPPNGTGSLLESVPARTSLPVLYDQGGGDDVEFEKISRIDFGNDRMKITFNNGQVKTGKFSMPTQLPAEARFLGITSQYKPESEDVFDFWRALGQLKSIEFTQQN